MRQQGYVVRSTGRSLRDPSILDSPRSTLIWWSLGFSNWAGCGCASLYPGAALSGKWDTHTRHNSLAKLGEEAKGTLSFARVDKVGILL